MNKTKKKNILKFCLGSFSLGFLLASTACSFDKNNSQTNSVQQNIKWEELELNKKIINDIFDNQLNEASNYIFVQNNIFDQNLVNLKFSLTNFNPSHPRFPNSNANGIISEFSKKMIFESLTNDWLWFLKNINHMEYYFNPYDINRYLKIENEDQLFNENDYLSKVLSIKNNEIQELIAINNNTTNYDYYNLQTTYYLKFDNNLVLRIIKFKKDNELKVKVGYDLFKFSSNQFDLNAFAIEYEKELENIKNKKYNDELNGLEKNQENQYNQSDLDYVNQKFSNQKYFNTNESTIYLEWLFEVYQKTNTKWNYERFSLRNVNEKIISKNNTNTKNNEIKNDAFLDQEFLKFIDKNQDVNIKGFNLKEYETNKIINSLLEEQFLNDNQKTIFLNQQNDKNYQNDLINKLKEYSIYFSNPKNKENNKSEYDQKLIEYKDLFSNNWYFVLKNINSFKGEFFNWYLLPETIDPKTNEVLKMSDEYKEKLIDKDPYRTFFMVDNYLDKKQEGDNSVAISDYKDFYITKNKSIINIRIDKQKNNAYILNPLIYYFPESKTPISINAITRIFHYALFHFDKRYYQAFEKELIEQYQYGIPAQMLLLWRN